jgi:L-threonylcarbamoyladenylate synthase
MTLSTNRAADVLLGGGVIAYPTEGVFGLGCLPDDEQAITRILDIKRRDPAKGMILIAADVEQLSGWVPDDLARRIPAPNSAKPTTWVVEPGPSVGALLRGAHESIAVRLTTNPVAAAICKAVESPITSTSANFSGRPVVRNRITLLRHFGPLVDYVVPGDCGPAMGASEIRRLEDGMILRQGSS